MNDDHLRDLMHRISPNGAAEKVEDEDLGPCASRATPKWWPGLIVKNLPTEVRGFQYAHLGHEEFFPDGTGFVFEFNSPEKWRLTVKGRNLWKIFLYIHQHRLEWIEKADRDFAGQKEAIITHIDISPGNDDQS